MRKFVVFISFALLLLTSCQRDKEEIPNDPILKLDESIMIDGLSRSYHVQHPPNAENKPLVLILHGHGGSSDQSLGLGTGKAVQEVWLDVAEENDFIVVVPNGELGPEDTRGWNDCREDAVGNPSTDDVEFLSKLIDKMKDEFNHDSDRVYVAGVSNGGFMAFRLVQEIPSKIAAFTSIVITNPINSICIDSDEAISALYMNGTQDPLAPYNGGQVLGNRGAVFSTEESINYWVERNQTDAEPIYESIPDLDPDDNSTVEKFTYANGTNGSEVVLYRVNGGGHTEPSLSVKYSQLYLDIVGEQNHDLEMADEVWSFFEDKSK